MSPTNFPLIEGDHRVVNEPSFSEFPPVWVASLTSLGLVGVREKNIALLYKIGTRYTYFQNRFYREYEMPNIIRRGINSVGNHYTVYDTPSGRSYWYSNDTRGPRGYSGTYDDDGYGSDGTYD